MWLVITSCTFKQQPPWKNILTDSGGDKVRTKAGPYTDNTCSAGEWWNRRSSLGKVCISYTTIVRMFKFRKSVLKNICIIIWLYSVSLKDPSILSRAIKFQSWMAVYAQITYCVHWNKITFSTL